MPSTGTINLISTKTSLSPQITAIEKSLRTTTYIALAIVFFLVATVGGAYVYFLQENRSLQEEKSKLVRLIIDNEKNKEGLYVSIKQRATVVSKAIETQKPWAQMLDTVGLIVQPPSLSALNVDDQNKVSMTLTLSSIDEVVDIMKALVTSVSQRRIHNPQLVSFQLEKDSGIQMLIAFTPIF